MTTAPLAILERHLLDALAAAPEEIRRLFHGRGRCYPGLEQLTVDWLQGVLDKAVPSSLLRAGDFIAQPPV